MSKPYEYYRFVVNIVKSIFSNGITRFDIAKFLFIEFIGEANGTLIDNPFIPSYFQRFSTFSFDSSSSSRNGIKLLNKLSNSRCISTNKSLVFSDNKKTPSNNSTDKIGASPHDDHPVEDLVNEPTEKKEKSLEINTNKGKLVVTTSSDGTELHNLVIEVKLDKKETDGVKSDDVDDPAKKVRVSILMRP